jgi:predicted TIM-barrel fold metal-dependent hydrolase
MVYTIMASSSGHVISAFALAGAGISSLLMAGCGVKWLMSRAWSRQLTADELKSKMAVIRAACGLLVVGCLSLTPVACRSARDDRSRPYVLSGDRLAEFTSIEPIDAHTHVSQTGTAFVGMLERLHMHVLDILYVDDTEPYRNSLEPQRQDALNFEASSKGHAQLCATFDPFPFNKADFSKAAIDALNQDFARGAIAAKIWKNVGMEIKVASGQYVMPDDPRFEPIYKDIAAHHKTLIIHAADPDAAWDAQYPTPAGAKYYGAHPEWDMSKKPGAPRKQTILDARDRVVAANPDLRIVGAHLGSMEAQLDDLGNRLGRHPNFAVDTAARIRRLTLQPRDKVRAFLLKYQDRILYGSDLSYSSGTTDPAASQAWENQYALDWRYLATDDSFEYMGHQVEGLNLPRSVLKKPYHDNAVRWIPGIDGGPH